MTCRQLANNAAPCWLCGLYPTEPIGTARAMVRYSPARSTPGTGNVAAALAGLLVLMVAAGVMEQAPGLGIVLLLVVLPALAALAVTVGREGIGAPSFGSTIHALC